MHGPQKTEISSPVLTLGGAGKRLMVIAGLVGVVALIAAFGIAYSAAEGADRMHDAYRKFGVSYLVAFCTFVTISIGALFFVNILHLTRAGWGVSVRRIAEILAMTILPMAILFAPICIPLLAGSDAVFEWNNKDLIDSTSASYDELIAHKSGYLNSGFFTIRALFYFLIWVAMAFFYFSNSLSQDKSGEKKLSLKMQSFAAPATLLFAATLVFSSFDWEMSIEPHWFSTIIPVYFFSGAFLSALATVMLVAYLLQKSGRVTEDITTDNYHDLAKLTFGFIFFWGYIAFSQYLLIWYANIPEETFWYLKRQQPGWAALSIVLLCGHLFIPFLGLMARTVRRNKTYLFGAAIYLLIMHWIDHYYLIAPKFQETFSMPSIVDLLCFVGMGGVYVALFCFVAADRPLVPMKDPRLIESLNYKNA